MGRVKVEFKFAYCITSYMYTCIPKTNAILSSFIFKGGFPKGYRGQKNNLSLSNNNVRHVLASLKLLSRPSFELTSAHGINIVA